MSFPPASQHADILIIGGGLSGTLLSMQLLRQPGSRRILVVEPRSELGKGEAYSATELGHTLNGNAARMSVNPDNPDDLTHWLTHYLAEGGWPEAAEQGVPVAQLFPPRGLFGVYARQRLAEARSAGAAQGSSAEHLKSRVVDIQVEAGRVQVLLSDGSSVDARIAVLATGLFPAARTPQCQSNGLEGVSLDPWNVAAMRDLDPHADVMVIGAGLTMVDALVSLQEAGHRGTVRVISRHGLLPQVRRQPPPWVDFLGADHSIRSPLQVFRALRSHCKAAIAEGIDWQAPLDTVRAHIGRLWSQASDRQRRQFIRHLRPWWESHHHRSPPQGGALLGRLLEEGRLTIQPASFLGLEAGEGGRVRIRVRHRGDSQAKLLEGAALINSSGIEYDWRRVDLPLPRQLLARGLIRQGPLALGIDAAADGAVKNSEGQVSTQLFAMGPPLRGLWWESTAVTDVASQAKALAARLMLL